MGNKYTSHHAATHHTHATRTNTHTHVPGRSFPCAVSPIRALCACILRKIICNGDCNGVGEQQLSQPQAPHHTHTNSHIFAGEGFRSAAHITHTQQKRTRTNTKTSTTRTHTHPHARATHCRHLDFNSVQKPVSRQRTMAANFPRCTGLYLRT